MPAEVARIKGLVKALVIEVGSEVHEIKEEMTVYFRKGREYEIAGELIIEAVDIIAFESTE